MTNSKPLQGGKAVRYVIISPVRDEINHIEQTIDSVKNQTILPTQWVIVDDGSTDGTAQILQHYAAQISWITLVHRPNRGRRVAGGGVVEAFYAGFAQVENQDWDYLVKLDGDLSFPCDYFAQCFSQFDLDAGLGMGGGTICALKDGDLKPEFRNDPPFHVRGATKIYRNACWKKIEPLIHAPGWDTIDEVKANYHGWTTRTFAELKLHQLKPTGGADGSWRNAFKNGRANYITGYHPLFMLLKCIRRLGRKPYLTGAAALVLGYCSGWWQGVPRGVEVEIIRYLRRQQLRHILFLSSIYRRPGRGG